MSQNPGGYGLPYRRKSPPDHLPRRAAQPRHSKHHAGFRDDAEGGHGRQLAHRLHPAVRASLAREPGVRLHALLQARIEAAGDGGWPVAGVGDVTTCAQTAACWCQARSLQYRVACHPADAR